MKFINVLVAALSCVALCFGLVFILTIVGAIGYGIIYPSKIASTDNYELDFSYLKNNNTVNLTFNPESEQLQSTSQDSSSIATSAETEIQENNNVVATANLSSETMGQKNALLAAKNYLMVLPFSYEGLITQLQYDKYSKEDSVYAADNCNADWNEQALKSAENYFLVLPFSYTGLITQLKYDGYTNEQATYAADNCNADWNVQAVKSAKNYLSLMTFSKEGLIEQLQFDGYTSQQASYAATQNGY